MPRTDVQRELFSLDLTPARESLAQMASTDALLHLESALQSLESLAGDLHGGQKLSLTEQRETERALLRFRSDLRHAGVLVEQGLAFCKDWTELLQPPASYDPSGHLRESRPESEHQSQEFLAEG